MVRMTIPKIQGGLYLSNISSMVASTEAEKHTRFLSTIIGKDKAFRIPCTIKKADGADIRLEKSYVQADQGSDMNVISTGLVHQIGLDMHSLSEIGFRGLTMRTADHRETLLEHWVWLNIGVEGVWRIAMWDSGEANREVTGPELVFCVRSITYLCIPSLPSPRAKQKQLVRRQIQRALLVLIVRTIYPMLKTRSHLFSKSSAGL